MTARDDGTFVPKIFNEADSPIDPDFLSYAHQKTLYEGSAISYAAITARQVRTVTDPRVLLDLGFSVSQARVPGMLFPIWSALGEIVGYTYRPDEPNGKRKYENIPGSPMRLDVPPLCRPHIGDPQYELFITEGVKKGDSISSAGGVCVTLQGVDNWRGKNPQGGITALADWNEISLNGRIVIPTFDSDMMTKRQVRGSLDRMTAWLRTRNVLEVYWTFLPQSEDGKTGIDDWLRDHDWGEIKDLLKDATDVLGEDPFFTFPFTDIGNAERFAWFLGDRARWCEEAKNWFCWDGRRWDGRPSLAIERLAIETIREMQMRAEALPPLDPRRDTLTKYAKGLENSRKFKDMIERSKSQLEINLDVFDENPYLLNCPNGVVDLRSGELLNHDPEHYQTKMTGVDYDPSASSEDWQKYLRDSCEGKEGMEDFLQIVTGYAATGLTVEEKLFMIVGPTRSGKTTFIEAVKDALGDYAVTADFETFLVKRHGESGASEGIAKLAGARFVSSSEVDKGRQLAIAAVKQLTGGDSISARFLYKGLFTFRPKFTLFLVANEEPLVPKDEEAVWERVLRFPFDNTLKEEDRDVMLKHRLKAEDGGRPAVLRWIVDGAVRWFAEGMDAPASVRLSTNEYRERMDPLTDFFDSKCLVHEGAVIGVTELMAAYIRWAKDMGEKVVLGRIAFSRAIEKRGFEKKRRMKGGPWQWHGIGLLASSSEESEDDSSNVISVEELRRRRGDGS